MKTLCTIHPPKGYRSGFMVSHGYISTSTLTVKAVRHYLAVYGYKLSRKEALGLHLGLTITVKF